MGIDAKIRLRNKGQHKTASELLSLSVDMTSHLGPSNFFIFDDHHALEQVDEFWQDGPEIYPEEGEQLVDCHVGTRYYGKGYARGDWPFLRNLFLFLSEKWPEAEIWYGGDSSGVWAEQMTPEKINELDAFWLDSGTSTYWMNADRSANILCDTCQVTPSSCGGGQGLTFYRCRGCGHSFISKGSRAWKAKHKYTEVFALSSALDKGDFSDMKEVEWRDKVGR